MQMLDKKFGEFTLDDHIIVKDLTYLDVEIHFNVSHPTINQGFQKKIAYKTKSWLYFFKCLFHHITILL